MALYMDDNYLHCPKCGNRELTIETVGLYTIIADKNGEKLIEELTGDNLRCIKCGTIVKHLPVGSRYTQR